MQSQFPLSAGDVVLDDSFLMRRQSVDNQMNPFLAIEHQLPEQRHKQLTGEAALVSRKPESPLRVHGGRRANALPLARSFDDRCFTTLGPCLAMHGIGAKARFIPEEGVSLFLPGLPGDGTTRC